MKKVLLKLFIPLLFLTFLFLNLEIQEKGLQSNENVISTVFSVEQAAAFGQGQTQLFTPATTSACWISSPPQQETICMSTANEHCSPIDCWWQGLN